VPDFVTYHHSISPICSRAFFDKRLSQEVPGEALGEVRIVFKEEGRYLAAEQAE
jgi:hypothetical protein